MSFYLKHVTKQKYNSYNYVKINCVFTSNSRGLWHQFWVRPACSICTVWPGSTLLAAQIHIFLYVNSYFLWYFFLITVYKPPISYCFMKCVVSQINDVKKNTWICVVLDFMISHMKHCGQARHRFWYTEKKLNKVFRIWWPYFISSFICIICYKLKTHNISWNSHCRDHL